MSKEGYIYTQKEIYQTFRNYNLTGKTSAQKLKSLFK